MNILGLHWEFDTDWVSEFGTLDGRPLDWTMPNKQSNPVGFTLHLVDVKKVRRVVCCIKIENYSEGYIQIPGGVVKDQSGLDEMITVAVSMLHRMRSKIKNEGSGGVGPEAACKVNADFPRNSFQAGWQVANFANGGGGGV